MTAYTTRAEVKSILGLTAVDQDAVIDLLIDWASQFIDSKTNRTFLAVSATRVHDWHNPNRLRLNSDLLTLTNVTCNDGEVLLPSTHLLLYPLVGPPYRTLEIKQGSGKSFTWSGTKQQALAVAGTWGRTATPPEDVVTACNLLVIQVLNEGADAGLESVTVDFAKQVFERELPPTVETTLAHYRSVGIG
jgi:hypothetical protein